MRDDGKYVVLDFAQVLGTEYDDDKHLHATIDLHGEEEAAGHPLEVLSLLGTVVRPLDPESVADGDPQGASPVLTLTHGDIRAVLPLNDPRSMSSLPLVKSGGYLTFCPAAPGSFAIFEGLDPKKVRRAGSFTLSTKYGEKAHLFELSVATDGKENVKLVHAEGMGLILQAGDTRSALLKNASGDAYVQVHDEGLDFVGKTRVTGNLTVGQMAAADSLVKAKTFEVWASMIEKAIQAVPGGVVPVSISALMAGMKTLNLKGS